ncbi:MAG: hypothetical protein J6S60_00615 [Oscillospiraceae bacterium]|nr:hypothetical protein [Oscillospiraceae bacterium]
MSLTENGGTTMLVQPSGFGGYGNGLFGGDGAWWIIILLLCGFGGWGMGGFGGGMWPMMMGGMGGGWGLDYLYPWLNNSQHISDGFRDQMLQTSITSIGDKVVSGFGDVQLGLAGLGRQICETGNGITGAVRDGFYGAEIAANNRQMANMQQGFGIQSGIADLKYTEATEACATRTANASNTRDIIDAVRGGNQAILDKLCALELDGYKREADSLRQQLNMAQLQASQTAQNAFISQGFANEVDALYNRLNSCPVPTTPVYGRTPIFTCGGNNTGCGCGGNTFFN